MHPHLIGSLLVTFARPQAYLDPGSGSMLLQLLIAGLLGAGLFLRASWSKIVLLFRRGDEAENQEEDDE
jgi:hypothetical protein